MISFFAEFFLSISLLILLIIGSIVGFSSKYNYPILSYRHFTTLIIFWTFLLLRFKTSEYFTAYFVVDNLSIFSKILITISLILCINFESASKKKTFEYYVLVLTSLLGIFLLCASNDLLSVYLSLELITFSFYILTLYLRTSAFSVEAALKYFILGALSSALLVFGISLIYGLTGTTNISHFLILNLKSYDPVLTKCIELSFIIFSFGLLFKIGCVPFHVWVADVYEGAHTSVTTIFSVLPKISIFALFIRIILATKLDIWFYLLLTLAFASILLGSFHALKQTKTKRILAFSGISHVGFALLGLAGGTVESISACLLYIVVYICTTGFIWGFVLCVNTSHGRTLYLTDHIQWVRTNPALGIAAVLVIFSLAGIPPLAGFFSKFIIFLSCIDLGLYLPTLFGILISAIGILYYLRLIKIISFEERSWKKTVKLEFSHVLSIGFFGFFVIFFMLYGDFVYFFTTAIILAA
jgi:NADH-quinone oxidoreductase subunit N